MANKLQPTPFTHMLLLAFPIPQHGVWAIT